MILTLKIFNEQNLPFKTAWVKQKSTSQAYFGRILLRATWRDEICSILAFIKYFEIFLKFVRWICSAKYKTCSRIKDILYKQHEILSVIKIKMACFNTLKIDESGVANKFCYVYTNHTLGWIWPSYPLFMHYIYHHTFKVIPEFYLVHQISPFSM